MKDSSPVVSIILPTYNRLTFLPDAIQAIRSQQWTDWELIIVDDGSTDGTGEHIEALIAGIEQPVRYIFQENQGAYGARNTGLDHAQGRYIAFYDSDDTWLSHHLQDCVQAMEVNADVDWVYGACSIHDLETGREVSPSTFSVDSRPRPFRSLKCVQRGDLHVLMDRRAACYQLRHGLYAGLQNSVIRSRVFKEYRFDAAIRNEAEDQVVVVKTLLSGYRMAYFDRVHVKYFIHDQNSSAVGSGGGLEKKANVVKAMLAGFENLLETPQLPVGIRIAIRERLGRDYFWALGYAILWQTGNRTEAKEMFRRGLHYWPWDWRCWKTMLLAHLRTLPLIDTRRDRSGVTVGSKQ